MDFIYNYVSSFGILHEDLNWIIIQASDNQFRIFVDMRILWCSNFGNSRINRK